MEDIKDFIIAAFCFVVLLALSTVGAAFAFVVILRWPLVIGLLGYLAFKAAA